MKGLRLFFYVATILVVLVVTGCGPKVDPNINFVQKLKGYIGTTNPAEIQKIAYERTELPKYANWMTDVEIGTFINNRGEEVLFKLSKGEPQYTLKKEMTVTKWIEPIGDVWGVECLDSENKVYLAIYSSGSNGTLGRLSQHIDELQKFVCTYFSNSSASINVLHLNFHSTGVPIQLEDIGNLGVTMPILQSDWDRTTAVTANLRPMNDGAVVRTDVLINLNIAQASSENIGLTTNQMLVMALTNEEVGWLANQYSPISIKIKPNESYSTLASITAAFDSETASLFLGDQYHTFIQLVSDEMEVLTTIANK